MPDGEDWRQSLADRTVIDWTQAPTWANYHTFDEDGRGFWYEVLPVFVGDWWHIPERTEWLMSNFALSADADWRQSLITRGYGLWNATLDLII